MKRIMLFVLTLCLCLTAFGTAFAEEADESGPVLNDGTPWVDWSLRENIAQAEDKPDSPKDDFFFWVNYDWLRSAEIAPGDYCNDSFTDAGNEVTAQCLEVLTDTTLKSEDAVLAQYLYNAYLDWDARDALGLAPLQKVVDRISAVSTLDELTQMLGDREYDGETLFMADVMDNLSAPDTWITDIKPMKLLLEDSAEYRERTEMGDLIEAVIREFFSRKTGWPKKPARKRLKSWIRCMSSRSAPKNGRTTADYPSKVSAIMTASGRSTGTKHASARAWRTSRRTLISGILHWTAIG